MKTAMTLLLAVIVLAPPVAAVEQKGDPRAAGRQASAREGAAARKAGTWLRKRKTPAPQPRNAKRRGRDTFFGLLRVGQFVTVSATTPAGYSFRVYSPRQRQRLIEEFAPDEADRQREAALSARAARGDETARREFNELRSQRQSSSSRNRFLISPSSLYEITKLGPDYVVLLRNDRELIISAPWIRSISRVPDLQSDSATGAAANEAAGEEAPGGGAAAPASPEESDLTEVVHLQSLIAREVSGTVSKLFPPEKVRIVADPKKNSLIVRGSRQDLDRVIQVVRLLEGRKAGGER